MARTLTAREVGQILGVSSKTVREWANEGVLKGVKIDNGPGKETWEFSEDGVYSCTDTRVVNRLKPEEVSERRNAQQRIEDLEHEIGELKASLERAEQSLQAEREERESALVEKALLHEQEIAEFRKKTDRYEDACFAVEDAMKAAIEAISLNRDLEELFQGKNIRVKHRMADDLESWYLRYKIQGRNAYYEMQEFKYEPESPLEGLNMYLLETEAGEFRGCRNPSKERLQARRVLYRFRLSAALAPLLLVMLLLMALGKIAPPPALGAIAPVVVAVVVVDLIYGVRIGIRKWKEEKKH